MKMDPRLEFNPIKMERTPVIFLNNEKYLLQIKNEFILCDIANLILYVFSYY